LQLSDVGPFAWVFAYAFVVCVALRLARYNVQHTESTSTGFTGLPTTAAGMTLATYYPFTQTDFFQTQLSHLPWTQILIFLTIALSLAMVSQIRYARLPGIGFRSRRGALGLAINLTILGFGIWSRDIFFFPLGITYFAYGFVRTLVVGFLERGDDEEDDEEAVEASNPVLVHDLGDTHSPSRDQAG
jgi:CDP-diacylglycerol--serine O-phosphatidyltransferase